MYAVPINYLASSSPPLSLWRWGSFGTGPYSAKHGRASALCRWSGCKKAPPLNYLVMFAGALVMAYVFDLVLILPAHISTWAQVASRSRLRAAALATAGFVAPAQLSAVLWEGKSWKYGPSTSAYYFVALSLIGVLLSLWQ